MKVPFLIRVILTNWEPLAGVTALDERRRLGLDDSAELKPPASPQQPLAVEVEEAFARSYFPESRQSVELRIGLSHLQRGDVVEDFGKVGSGVVMLNAGVPAERWKHLFVEGVIQKLQDEEDAQAAVIREGDAENERLVKERDDALAQGRELADRLTRLEASYRERGEQMARQRDHLGDAHKKANEAVAGWHTELRTCGYLKAQLDAMNTLRRLYDDLCGRAGGLEVKCVRLQAAADGYAEQVTRLGRWQEALKAVREKYRKRSEDEPELADKIIVNSIVEGIDEVGRAIMNLLQGAPQVRPEAGLKEAPVVPAQPVTPDDKPPENALGYALWWCSRFDKRPLHNAGGHLWFKQSSVDRKAIENVHVQSNLPDGIFTMMHDPRQEFHQLIYGSKDDALTSLGNALMKIRGVAKRGDPAEALAGR